MNAPAVAVLVTGDPIPQTLATRGRFLDLIRAAAPGFAGLSWMAYDVRALDVAPDLTGALGVIVTGSPFSVTERLRWIERTSAQLRALVRADVPVLGICFGHQLLAHALGGRVAPNPRGREMGSVQYTSAANDPVVGGPGSWIVNSTHVDAVVELPPGARALGATELDPHAAVRFGRRAWGVQFHPEIDAGVMRQYIDGRRTALLAEGFDLSLLERSVREAPRGLAVIERFLRFAIGQGEPRGEAILATSTP